MSGCVQYAYDKSLRVYAYDKNIAPQKLVLLMTAGIALTAEMRCCINPCAIC